MKMNNMKLEMKIAMYIETDSYKDDDFEIEYFENEKY